MKVTYRYCPSNFTIVKNIQTVLPLATYYFTNGLTTITMYLMFRLCFTRRIFDVISTF